MPDNGPGVIAIESFVTICARLCEPPRSEKASEKPPVAGSDGGANGCVAGDQSHTSTRNREVQPLVAGVRWAMPVTSGSRMGEALARSDGGRHADAPGF